MKALIGLLFLISCSQAERSISSAEDHKAKLMTLFEASPTDPVLDRHEYQRRKTHRYYICKEKDGIGHALATEPVGVSAAFSVQNRFEACKLITRAEYRNHQN